MWGYFCFGFMGFMMNNKNLIDFTNLFSLNNVLKNHKIILEYFQ